MQKFTIAKDEEAVLQVKFMTREGEIVNIHEAENAEWISDSPETLKVISSQFDGTNYNVTVAPQQTGKVILTAKGWFLGNEKFAENDYLGYPFSGSCEVEVRPALVKQVFFTLSHRKLKSI